MNKKKIALLAMSLCMIAILAVGGSLAFLTDTDHQTNTFTAGHVNIKLDEAIVVEDPKTDNLVAAKPEDVEDGIIRTPVEMTEQDYKLHPNMTVCKDPTITVHKDSERCYVGAKITVTGDIYSLYGVPGYDNLDIHGLVSGGLVKKDAEQVRDWNGLDMVYETDECVIYQVADKATNTWIFYIFVLDAQDPTAEDYKPVVLFNTMTISPDFDNDEMAKLDGMEINIQAFAVQADGFELVDNRDEACFNAMTEAFGIGDDDAEWAFANNYTTVTEPAA